MFEIEECILCGSKEKNIITELYDQKGERIDLFRCQTCKLTYCSKKMTKYEMESLYEKYVPSAFVGTNEEEKERKLKERQKEAIRQLETIEKYTIPRNIFDVGCGPGIFLNEVIKKGYHAYGNELSKSSIKMGESLFPKIKFIFGELKNINLNTKFDVIVMWNTIEHSSDPLKDMEKAINMLDKNGYIYIKTPIHGDNDDKMKSYHMLPEHQYTFCEKSLEYLFNKCNLSIQEKRIVREEIGVNAIEVMVNKR